MKNIAYEIKLTRLNDEQDTILVEVPDLKQFTQGHGIADAMYMARDLIGTYYLDVNEVIKPGSNKDYVSEFVGEGEQSTIYVDIDIDEYRKKYEKKMVRKNVTIPSWLNYRAEQENINVSRVLQEALMQKLGC